MRKILFALGFILASGAAAHAADSAQVVLVCGTPNTTYTVGRDFAITQNTSGLVCMNATVTVSGTSDVNLKQINGATANAFNTGVVGASTLRVTLATDVALPTGANVIGGVTQSGNWTARIVGNIGGIFDAVLGAAPPANAVQVSGIASGATGGLTSALKTCDLHAKYDASDNGNSTLVTGVSGRKVYICGYVLANGVTATNLSLTEGSDANCATNNAALTPAYQLVANASIGVMTPFWTGLAVSTNAYFVCVKSSAGNAHQAELFYSIQ